MRYNLFSIHQSILLKIYFRITGYLQNSFRNESISEPETMEVHFGSLLDIEPIILPSVSYMTTDSRLFIRFLQSISYKPTICETLLSSLVHTPMFFVD